MTIISPIWIIYYIFLNIYHIIIYILVALYSLVNYLIKNFCMWIYRLTLQRLTRWLDTLIFIDYTKHWAFLKQKSMNKHLFQVRWWRMRVQQWWQHRSIRIERWRATRWILTSIDPRDQQQQSSPRGSRAQNLRKHRSKWQERRNIYLKTLW